MLEGEPYLCREAGDVFSAVRSGQVEKFVDSLLAYTRYLYYPDPVRSLDVFEQEVRQRLTNRAHSNGYIEDFVRKAERLVASHGNLDPEEVLNLEIPGIFYEFTNPEGCLKMNESPRT